MTTFLRANMLVLSLNRSWVDRGSERDATYWNGMTTRTYVPPRIVTVSNGPSPPI